MRVPIILVAAVAGCGGAPPAHAPPIGDGSETASPPASAEAARDPMRLAMGVDGTLYIGDAPVSLDDLSDAIPAGSPVVIVAHPHAKSSLLVTVFDALRAAGFQELALESGSATAPAPPGLPAPSSAPVPATTPEPTPPPVETPPLPNVEVKNIGLHIGGGPNDDATKAPIRGAISKRFDDFRACFSKAEEAEKGGTFGVDLTIPAEGGVPTVKQARTAIHGKDFRDCVSRVFASVEFEKPNRGAMTISYSIRFTPK